MASINKILIAALLFLSGCLGQSTFNSVIDFTSEAQSEIIAERVRTTLDAFVLKSDGTCTHRTRSISCRFPKRGKQNSSSIVFSGIGQDGIAYIAIRTTRGHWLLPTKKGMEEGRYISDFHKELERWATDAFAEFQPQTRTRSYSGYGVIGSF